MTRQIDYYFSLQSPSASERHRPEALAADAFGSAVYVLDGVLRTGSDRIARGRVEVRPRAYHWQV
jgi:2-hydroxychromene-2-carboxylate isomerase